MKTKSENRRALPKFFLIVLCSLIAGILLGIGIAFAEGDRLQLPVILETDAQSKCDKYLHLGMELAGTRDFGRYGKLYDLIRYPAKP